MEIQLQELIPEDYEKLKKYFGYRNPGTCESVILDSYLWKQYYQSKYFITEHGLMWVLQAAGETFSLIPLSPKEHLKEAFYELKDYFNHVLKQKLNVYLADEEAVQILDLPPDEFCIEEDRRYFDYVYDGEKMRTLSGKKYHKKKNHVNAFYKEYEGRYEFRVMNCSDRETILDFLAKWKETRNIEDEFDRVDFEYEGIKYVLEHCQMINSIGGGIYIDGKLEAFSLASFSEEENTAYIHVEKANPEIRGLYTVMSQQFLIHSFPYVEFVNREDDMGLEGLRQSKLSYNPVNLVKKYNIMEK